MQRSPLWAIAHLDTSGYAFSAYRNLAIMLNGQRVRYLSLCIVAAVSIPQISTIASEQTDTGDPVWITDLRTLGHSGVTSPPPSITTAIRQIAFGSDQELLIRA